LTAILTATFSNFGYLICLFLTKKGDFLKKEISFDWLNGGNEHACALSALSHWKAYKHFTLSYQISQKGTI
jgi:hypothetical protein